MDLAALRIFTTVVSEGGIGPAARKLHRVPSNVSTRIRQLEESLGTTLFLRENRRLHLTPAGERFLVHAERLIAGWEEARAAVCDRTPRGLLRIGALESTAASRMPALLARYHARFPAVRVELSTGTTDALITAVAARDVAAAFVADFEPGEHLYGEHAFTEELALITPRDHPPVARARDVVSDTVICFPQGCAYRRRIHRWLAADGVLPERVLELSSYHAIVACVASGTGIALVPRSVMDTLAHAEVAVHRLPPRARRSLTWLVRHPAMTSPALEALYASIPRRR